MITTVTTAQVHCCALGCIQRKKTKKAQKSDVNLRTAGQSLIITVLHFYYSEQAIIFLANIQNNKNLVLALKTG